MRRHHPNPQMSVPISLEIYQQLLGASSETCFEKEDWEIAAEAIDDWIRRHNPDAIAMPAMNGYQWKSVFLPDGTLLRTVFGGKNYHCLVEADHIVYDGQAISPSVFVNTVGGVRRNAWRCTWVLFPDTKEWKLADALRTRERPRRERNPSRNFQQPSATQACVARTPVAVPPVPGPIPTQLAPDAASASQAVCVPRAGRDHAHPNHERSDSPGPLARTGTMLSPPQCERSSDRRAIRDDRMPALLREELLPLLYRLCAFAAKRPETQAWPEARDR